MEKSDTFLLQKALYEDIRSDWYTSKNLKNTTNVILRGSENAPGYSLSANTIYLSEIEEFRYTLKDQDTQELFDMLLPQSNEWEQWKKDIVEEALHEYQAKHIGSSKKVEDLAISLWKFYKNHFAPRDKHNIDFFQAIVDKADYFSLTPEELVKILAK
jgi:hypothetical protein